MTKPLGIQHIYGGGFDAGIIHERPAGAKTLCGRKNVPGLAISSYRGRMREFITRQHIGGRWCVPCAAKADAA